MKRLDNTRRALAEKNLGLVYFTIGQLGITRFDRDYDDFEGAGFVALCRAALAYEKTKAEFSTFAVKAIRNEIMGLLIKRARESRYVTSFDAVGKDVAEECRGFKDAELCTDFCKARFFMDKESFNVTRLAILGKSRKETAAKLGITIDRVDTARLKARKILKAMMQKEE